MNGSPVNSSPSYLNRWMLVLGVAMLSAALLGAAQARPVRPQVQATPVVATVASPAPSNAGRELMVAIPAPVASANVPAVAGAKRVIWMEVTAYCGCPKCCGPHAHGLTASGRSVGYNGGRFVAADTKLFKFGTQLQIPGYANGETVEVIDRGGAIKGLHLDVFFATHEKAKEWGRRWIPVTITD